MQPRKRTPLASIALGVVALLTVVACALAADEPLAGRTATVERDYANRLEDLAKWCEKHELSEETAATRAWIIPQPPLTLVLAVPDEPTGAAEQRSAGPASDWAKRFRELRQTQAKSLYELALSRAGERQFAEAYQLLHAVLREDPDHETARQLLGFKRHEGKWLSQYEFNKARGNQVWHPKFGWLGRNQVQRYEAGERFFKGRWISASDDARLHADLEHGWDVVTEHFQVRTDHSLEEGVKLATQLEEFYGVWRQLFVRYYVDDEQLARMFREATPLPRRTRPHQVACFRDRDEYNDFAALGQKNPTAGITTGCYSCEDRRAYFFAGPEQDAGNICHEATHQLFYELRPAKHYPGRDANFWVTEGIACFMESYRRANGLVLLGGLDAHRLKNAHGRLDAGFYLGLAELCSLGMEDLKQHDDIKAIYSESAGMTYFLLYADEGRYRQALVDYLAAVYANRDRPDTLSELTGVAYDKLDEQYQHFIQSLP
jgi:hypothetical protein